LEAIDLTGYCIAVNKEGGTDVGPFKRIVIKLGDAVDKEMTGTLRVSYHKIGYQRGGLSIPKTNLCAVATRINGKPKDASGQNQILIHELGHQIGMVPSHDPQGNVGPRSAAELDRHANQYEGKGHNGSHCCNGLDAMATDYLKVKEGALCVMFGSVRAPTTFCVDCASAVRRKDLSAGFTFV
jgi:type VI secretion system secreted protein VgrG